MIIITIVFIIIIILERQLVYHHHRRHQVENEGAELEETGTFAHAHKVRFQGGSSLNTTHSTPY